MNSASWVAKVQEELGREHPDGEKLFALSQEMHDREASGYEISPLEDRWWIRLTTFLEKK